MSSYGNKIKVIRIALLILFLPVLAAAQSRYSVISNIDKYVEEADSLSNKSERTFYLEKFLKNDRTYRETWRYSVNGGKVVVFQVNFMLDSIEFTEVYYLRRGDLIRSEEYETVNFSDYEDELKWGGVYYFSGAVPQQVVTIGKKDENSSPETMALMRFEKRFSELKRHIPMLP